MDAEGLDGELEQSRPTPTTKLLVTIGTRRSGELETVYRPTGGGMKAGVATSYSESMIGSNRFESVSASLQLRAQSRLVGSGRIGRYQFVVRGDSDPPQA